MTTTVELFTHPYCPGTTIMYFPEKLTFIFTLMGKFQVWDTGMEIPDVAEFLDECCKGENITSGFGTECDSFEEAINYITH
jgi:hypothetical protein